MSNCSNNYGPHQFPEKLIPLMTINALEGRAMPIYGRDENIRDWLSAPRLACLRDVVQLAQSLTHCSLAAMQRECARISLTREARFRRQRDARHAENAG